VEELLLRQGKEVDIFSGGGKARMAHVFEGIPAA